ncbi:TonB-dependent receptor [Cellulophaga baltica]|uniref:TonB-dependent receptor plug domain-containing protein n=1 Tax=Cellulophaga TaxID=104264 RepID=UPI001C06B4BE|nr:MULTISPECIES: TonB-dependent receptor [Cellulophaga]MBU2997413.1 TonB-dependent receptor [Cellulophaga baltica]MDO6768810.1 TonB-dependent receptor [Cellulophaga sp. 1_MG-2023]
MNKKILNFCALALASTGLIAQEQQKETTVQKLDEVVVSDSRFELKRENSGKTVIKITEAEMERNQGKTIAEIINTKSGIEINGSRSRDGEVFGLYVRGGRGKQVLVTIDGVRVSDPSSTSSEYDLRLLSTANVASIEIIKGAASTLYGTNAATAVINITTKKVSEKNISGNFQSSLGTQQTASDQNYNISEFTNSALVSGTVSKFNYSVGFSNRYSDGLSSLITEENEKDFFSNYSTDVKLGYEFSEKFNLKVYANQTKYRSSYDESFGYYDADYLYNSDQERVGLVSEYKYSDNGSIQLNAAYTNYESESVSSFPSTYTGNNYTADIFNKYVFNDQFFTILGLNYIQDESEFAATENITITDPYANVVYVSPFGLNLNVGARFNNNSEYGSHLVYNVNPSYSYSLDNGYVKVLGSYATSYITPSLSQLYGFFGANPDLEPEESETIEGGLEYSNDKLRLSALYFNRDENQTIIYGTLGYENVDGYIKAEGVEVELDWSFCKSFNLSSNYTFTERTGDTAIRIPKHKVNANLAYQISDNTNATLSYAFTGERYDTNFNTFLNEELSSFSLVNLYFSHQLFSNKLKVFLNAENLFNEEYTEVIGYTTRGRNFRLGLNLTL